MWTPDGARRADVLVEDGRIAAVAKEVPRRDAGEVIDAAGMHVVPGFIDVHVHVDDRVGSYELADDFASGTEVAVRNGITTVFAFATQRPGETLEQCVGRYRERAAGMCHCDVGLHLTPTAWTWDWDAIERLAAGGVRTLKLYTTYREAGLFTDWERLEDVMRGLAAMDLGLLLHCEDDDVLAAAAARSAEADPSDPFSHAIARPEAAEVEAIRRAVDLAERTGCRLHVVHVSTARGAEMIVAARRRGAPVTCETCPQYLLLSDARLRGEGGHRFLCSPPLRDAATRAAWSGSSSPARSTCWRPTTALSGAPTRTAGAATTGPCRTGSPASARWCRSRTSCSCAATGSGWGSWFAGSPRTRRGWPGCTRARARSSRVRTPISSFSTRTATCGALPPRLRMLTTLGATGRRRSRCGTCSCGAGAWSGTDSSWRPHDPAAPWRRGVRR